MKGRTGNKRPQYSEEQVTKWLSWMAGNMRREGKTVFLIENMQEYWLTNSSDRVISRMFSILAVVFFSLLAFSPFGIRYGLAIGALVGLAFSIGNASITLRERTIWSWEKLKNTYQGILALRGIFAGFLIGMFFAFLSRSSISVGLMDWVTGGMTGGFTGGLVGALIGGLIGGLIEITTKGWEIVVSQSTVLPNEGIKLTLRNSAKGLVIGVFYGLIFGVMIKFLISSMESSPFISAIFPKIEHADRNEILLVVGGLGLLIGFLWFGGMSVIRHYFLRIFIWLRGHGPLDYEAFLNYVVDELQFMQRVGGGYIFIHRMLLEHFAEMGEDKTPAIE